MRKKIILWQNFKVGAPALSLVLLVLLFWKALLTLTFAHSP